MPRKRTDEAPRLLLLPAIFAAAFVGILGGCSSGDTGESSSPPAASTTTVVTTTPGATTATTTTAPGTPARNENTNAGPGGATGTETALADAINKKIIRNPQMTGSRVTAVVDASGVAVLNGFTQNQQQKALAEKAARDTEGIASVKNKLEIRPTGGTGKTAKTPPPPPAPKTTVIVVPAAPAEREPSAPPASSEPAPEPVPAGPATEPAPPGGGGSGSPAAPPPPPPTSPGGGQ